MRFYVENFGCRASQADGAALEREFLTRGYQRTATAVQADFVIVNTCTVTAAADTQARQWIRKLHRANPACCILATGCYAQRAPQELAALPGVAWVVGNSHKAEIPQLIEPELVCFSSVPVRSGAVAATRELSRTGPPVRIVTGNIFAQQNVMVAPVFGGENYRTRPSLKIQDGCNQRCAYCVIPYVRGRSRSLPPEAVLEQIHRLVNIGYKEVVLTGVNLGSYGRDLKPATSLRQLTECILAETALPQLRFSSIEPGHLTPEFICLLASSERIARHLHVPLQSGSDCILRRMRRGYCAEDYAARLLAAHAALPNAGLGADVLVGFPGESEADFRATYELIERLPFTYLHVFSFSKRPGTPAAAMPDQIPVPVVKERSRALRALGAEKQRCFRQQQLGRTLKVLTLARVDGHGRVAALSENYIKVKVTAPLPPNQLLPVHVSGVTPEGLLAHPLN